MSGGSTSEANNSITFNDTSEYVYRNSSTKRGGFKGNVGRVTTNTDLNIDGAEDVSRTQEQLQAADRDRVSNAIATLTDCAVAQFCADEDDLQTKAQTAWDRAINLYPDKKALIEQELDALRQDAIDRICLRERQWARAAGSSLNCLVMDLKARAEVELERALNGLLAEKLVKLTEHETAAISEAFTQNFNATMQTKQLAFSHIGALWGILRGAHVTDLTDRDYMESRNEDTSQLSLMGEFYHEATDISDNSGTYASEVDSAFAASQAIAGLVPSA